MKTLGPILGVFIIGFIGWQSQIANSAVVVRNNIHGTAQLPINAEEDPNLTLRLFEEAAKDYSELTSAYYSPAKDEATREKRTLNIIRNLANRTRAGFTTVRNLFAGFGGAGAGGSGGSGGFRSFFSNLLQRFLIFLTNLWDRITGFFRNGGSSGGGGSGGGFLSRIFGGGAAGGGGLFSLFRPPTTTESYFSDSDFYYSSSTTEKEKDPVDDNEVSNTENKEPKGKSLDGDDVAGETSDDFIPFPGGDDDLNTRINKPEERSPVALPVKAEEDKPHVVNSPSIIHLLDDGRRFA